MARRILIHSVCGHPDCDGHGVSALLLDCGYAVNRWVTHEAPHQQIGRPWVVSHVATGRRIPGLLFPNASAAVECARQVAAVIAPDANYPVPEPTKKQARAIVHDWQARGYSEWEAAA